MSKNRWLLLTSGALACFGLLTGCTSQQVQRTYEVSEIDNYGTQNTTVQEYVGPHHKRVVNKQVVREEVQCIGPNGKPLRVDSVEECIKRKGKVIDEVYREEKTFTK